MCNKSFFFFDVIRIIHYIAESNYIQFNRKKKMLGLQHMWTQQYTYIAIYLKFRNQSVISFCFFFKYTFMCLVFRHHEFTIQ